MHRRIHPGCRRIAQGTGGQRRIWAFCRSAASRRGHAREGQGRQRRQRDHCGWCQLWHRFLRSLLPAEIAGETAARTIQLRHRIRPGAAIRFPAVPIGHRLPSNQAVLSEGYDDVHVSVPAQASTRRPSFDRVGCATRPCGVVDGFCSWPHLRHCKTTVAPQSASSSKLHLLSHLQYVHFAQTESAGGYAMSTGRSF